MKSKRPRSVSPLVLQGLRCLEAGDTARAEMCLRQALTSAPDDAEALHLLGVLALQRADPESAVGLIERAIARDRSVPQYFSNLGNALREIGRVAESETAYRRALRLDPAYAMAHDHLATVLAEQGRHQEALVEQTRAVRLDPASAGFLLNLARAQKDLGQLDPATNSYRQAIARAPAEPQAHYGLGVALGLLGRYDEAEASLQRALELRPEHVDTLLALGLVLRLAGRFDAALAAHDRALGAAPGNTEIHARKASVLLHQGSLLEGWREYEWRNEVPARIDNPSGPGAAVVQRPSSVSPLDLGAKRVLLIRDQGLGDELFFLGFAKLAKQRGAWLAYMASEPLRGLLAGAQELDAVVGPESLPADVDLVVSVGDLPGLVGVASFAGIPAPLSLAPSAARVEGLRSRLAGLPPGPLIGVTWRGGMPGPRDNQLREVAPAALSGALAGWPGPVIVLQRNPRPAELVEFARALGRPVYDFSDLNGDLEAMLALLSVIDEYAGIGNTNMHLRATLGRVSRVLVPQRADWMWAAEGPVSPWLPHFRLYRSVAQGRWDEPLAAIAADLAAAAVTPRAV